MVYLGEAGGKLITLALCPGGSGGACLDAGLSVEMGLLPGGQLARLPLGGHAGVLGGGAVAVGGEVGAHQAQHCHHQESQSSMGHGRSGGDAPGVEAVAPGGGLLPGEAVVDNGVEQQGGDEVLGEAGGGVGAVVADAQDGAEAEHGEGGGDGRRCLDAGGELDPQAGEGEGELQEGERGAVVAGSMARRLRESGGAGRGGCWGVVRGWR